MDQLPDVRNIQAWIELSEDDLVVRDGRVFLPRTALVPYQLTFADFEQCVEECLGVFKFVGVRTLASQGLSGRLYRSFSSLMPRDFLTQSIEYLMVPLLGVPARLRVYGWISLELKESVPVQYLTIVNSWRNGNALLEELEALKVGRLWLSRDGLQSGPGINPLLTMVDSFSPFITNSGFALVTLGKNCLLSFVWIVHSYFSLQLGRLYAQFEDLMVRAARQAVHQIADLYDVVRVDLPRIMGEDDWIVVFNGCCQGLGWNEQFIEDEFLA